MLREGDSVNLQPHEAVVTKTPFRLADTSDPDATFTLTNVVGRSVVLLFSGYDNPERGGFSELQVSAKR